MNKKLIWIPFFAIVYLVYLWNPSSYWNKDCPFCELTIQRQQFYEDDYVIALLDHRPITEGHALIIPKRHVERFDLLTEEEIAHIGGVIKKIHRLYEKHFDVKNYLLFQKNGREVGQSVPHLHFHYVPKSSQDHSLLWFMFKIHTASFHATLSDEQIAKKVNFLKDSI